MEKRQGACDSPSATLRRPHSTYQNVIQGKCPLHFLHFNGVVCSNTLFSNTSALTNSLLFMANSTRKILEHLVWSNTSGFQFWGPLARTDFLSALCGPGPPTQGKKKHINIDKFAGFSRGTGWVAKICLCVFSGRSLWVRKTHKQNPDKNPWTIP